MCKTVEIESKVLRNPQQDVFFETLVVERSGTEPKPLGNEV